MPAKVTPIKPKTPAISAAEVDEFAMLREQLKPMNKRHDHLKTKFEAAFPALAVDANATATAEGTRYVVTFGARTKEKKVTGLQKLMKLLGVPAFLRFVEACRPSQKALDGALCDPLAKAQHDPALRDMFIVESQTGHRNIEVVRKFTEDVA